MVLLPLLEWCYAIISEQPMRIVNRVMDLVLKPRFFDIDSSQVNRDIYHIPFQRYVKLHADVAK